MKANELRIGNYYKPTDGSVEKFKNVTADDLKAWSLGAIYGKLIPLTEEWLKDFGFHRQTGEHYYIFFKDKILFSIYAGALVIEGGYMPLELKYVHQLQNLYFALTGEELEIK